MPTDPTPRASSRDTDIAAALLMLDRMGLSAQELLATPTTTAPVPTFAEYIPLVSTLVSDGTRRVYQSYWNRILQRWPQRRLDEPTASDIKLFMKDITANVVVRRNARGGASAAEHFVAALRCLYRHAEDDGLIDAKDNPARKVSKPRRKPSTRHALADQRLIEINQVACSGGTDPALDALLLRLHTETACRRGGALALRPQDLDRTLCLIFLREKGQTFRWQPVSPTLMQHLDEHAVQRCTRPELQLLRYASGNRITRRRYDTLWDRIGKALPWVVSQGISTHWLRHTTLTWVERNCGYAVAAEYAGHTDNGDAGTTTTYVRASREEVARALSALTGENHPMVTDHQEQHAPPT